MKCARISLQLYVRIDLQKTEFKWGLPKSWFIVYSSENLKADSHIACRAHAVSLPCRAAKGLECVSPIWFTQYCCVWFTHAIPRSDHAILLKATAQHGRRETACGLTARVQLLPAVTRSWDISGYHAGFHEEHGTIGAGQGRGMACVN